MRTSHTAIMIVLTLSASTWTHTSEAGPGASRFTPSAEDIHGAIQRRFDASMAAADALAEQCNHVSGDSANVLSAVGCMMSGFGSVNSESMQIEVNSVQLDECVRSDDDIAYCRYSVDADMKGSGIMSGMEGLFSAAMVLGGWSYGSFTRQNDQWHLQQTYDNCSWGDGRIRCTWRE